MLNYADTSPHTAMSHSTIAFITDVLEGKEREPQGENRIRYSEWAEYTLVAAKYGVATETIDKAKRRVIDPAERGNEVACQIVEIMDW